jgi:NADH dehydrogenase FAD-containing subunit
MATPPPRVVILGAGYAGALVARVLEEDAKAGKICVTVVERREAVHHKIGAIRATVRGGEWAERVRIPLNRVIRHGRTIVGDVVAINEKDKILTFKDPSQPPLRFDILVCATGTLNHSPGDLPPHLSNKDEVRGYFRQTAQAIREARDIVVVGGGASAVEFAGEIREAYPDKPITILCSAAHLLSSSVAPMSPKFLKQLYETLASKKIRLIRGEKVVKPEGADFGTKKFERGPLKLKTYGDQNMEITTDLLLWAATWAINTSIYPEEWLNEMGELNIRSTFQLVERPDIFAVGDVCSLVETKQAITLPPKMKLIRNNIVKVAETITKGTFEKGIVKGLKDYKVSDKVTMYLPVGSNDGVTQIGKSVYGGSKTSKHKGKDLYTDFFWKHLTGSDAPHLVNE